MKSRSFFSILSGVVLGLVLLGAIGAFWLTARTAQLPKPTDRSATPTAAMFVPRQAAAMVSLLVNPDRLESFWVAESSAAQRKTLKANLAQLQHSLFATMGLDYERDLQAWIGDEVTFALTSPDADRDPTNGTQPGYLLALTVQDPQSAESAIQAFWRRRVGTKDLVTETFAGVPIVHADDANSTDPANLASATVGNQYVLFANSPKVLRSALNDVQVPTLSLESSFTYQQALEQLPQKQLGFVFANVAQLQPWLGQSLLSKTALSDLLNPPNSPTDIRYESLLVTLEPDPQGIVANAALRLSEPGLPPANQAAIKEDSPLLKFIPSGSRFAIAGKNLPQTWKSLSTLQEGWLGSLPLAARVQTTLASLQQQWGIDFAAEVFDWVTGEYAIAQIPRADRNQPDWIFVTQRSPETEAGLDRLDQIAEDQGASIGSFSLGDQKISAWTKLVTRTSPAGTAALQAEVQGVHTTIGAYELIATSLEAMQQALQTSQSENQPDFQSAAARLQTPNQGYIYLDQKMLAGLQAQLGLEPLKPLINSTQSAVLSSYGRDETGLRGAAFLHLEGL